MLLKSTNTNTHKCPDVYFCYVSGGCNNGWIICRTLLSGSFLHSAPLLSSFLNLDWPFSTVIQLQVCDKVSLTSHEYWLDPSAQKTFDFLSWEESVFPDVLLPLWQLLFQQAGCCFCSSTTVLFIEASWTFGLRDQGLLYEVLIFCLWFVSISLTSPLATPPPPSWHTPEPWARHALQTCFSSLSIIPPCLR